MANIAGNRRGRATPLRRKYSRLRRHNDDSGRSAAIIYNTRDEWLVSGRPVLRARGAPSVARATRRCGEHRRRLAGLRNWPVMWHGGRRRGQASQTPERDHQCPS